MEATASIIIALILIGVIIAFGRHIINKGRKEAGITDFVIFTDEQDKEMDFGAIDTVRRTDLAIISRIHPMSQARIMVNNISLFCKPFRAKYIGQRLTFYDWLKDNAIEGILNGRRVWEHDQELHTAELLFDYWKSLKKEW